MLLFYRRLNEFRSFAAQTEKIKIEKKIVYNNAEKLYSILLTNCFSQYNNIADKEHMDEKYPENLLLKRQRFNESKKKDKSKAQPEESILEKQN